MTQPLVIRGGDVLDATGVRRADVVVTSGVVRDVGPDAGDVVGARVLDASGCIVAPGLVDIHAHLREPGTEEAETVESAARAAALGGYTAVVAMPNTDPPVDSAGVAREILALGSAAAVEVCVAGAITVGRAGSKLAPMGELAALGVRIFTDDGRGVQDGMLMRRALDYARGLDVTLAQHCEDERLSSGGTMHEGEWSSRLGLPGVPAAAEEAMVARDIALVRETGGRVHFCHLSSAGSVALVRSAKGEGLRVTAEATPHHLVLTDAACASYDAVFKVNPPLRGERDTEAVRAGLLDGTIDAVATDHAPHTPESKDVPFDEAPPGMLGLQSALPIVLEALGAAEAFRCLSWRPAAIAGLAPRHGGPVAPGAPANLCVVDPTARWTLEREAIASRSRNSPFLGWSFTGRARHTVVAGEPVVVDAEALR